MRPLQSLRGELHKRFLELRSLDRFVNSEVFEKTYNSASAANKQVAEALLKDLDNKGLDKWVNQILKASRLLEEFNVTELRVLCGELGVKQYRHMTKQMLVFTIRQHQEKQDGKASLTTQYPTTPCGNAVPDFGVGCG